MKFEIFSGPVYERDQALHKNADVLRWWEARRWYYNKIVGGVGLVATFFMISCGILSEPLVGEPIGIPDPPALVPLGILAYGLAANLCFTGGWIVECMLRTKTADTGAFTVRAFRYGIGFSIALTFLPAMLCWIAFG